MHRPRHTQRPLQFAACLFGILALSLASVSSAKIYRWVDENGVVRFSDQPPSDQQAETITVNVPKPATAREKAGADLETVPVEAPQQEPESEPEPAPPPTPEQLAEAQERAEKCQRARNNLQLLRNNPPNRLRGTDEDGNVYRLTVEDHTERMQRAGDSITQFCDN